MTKSEIKYFVSRCEQMLNKINKYKASINNGKDNEMLIETAAYLKTLIRSSEELANRFSEIEKEQKNLESADDIENFGDYMENKE